MQEEKNKMDSRGGGGYKMNFVAKRFQTTAGSKITYNVPVNGQKFLIKNLTDGDVYVSLKETENKEECLLIPADTAQIVQVYDGPLIFETNVVTVIPEATSEKGVEVQCLKW